MSDIPEKRCTKCGETKPLNEFGQYKSQCKQCKLAYQNEYRLRPEIREKRKAETKTYNSRPEVKDRIRSYEQRPEVRERIKSRDRERGKRPKRQAWAKAYLQEYHQHYLNRPGIREYQKAQRKAYHQRLDIKERWRTHAHTYRARQRSVNGTHTVAQIQDLLKRQRYRCYYCSNKFTRVSRKYVYHVDHTFPLSRASGDDPINSIDYLVLACPRCNDSKGNKYPWEWIDGGRLL